MLLVQLSTARGLAQQPAEADSQTPLQSAGPEQPVTPAPSPVSAEPIAPAQSAAPAQSTAPAESAAPAPNTAPAESAAPSQVAASSQSPTPPASGGTTLPDLKWGPVEGVWFKPSGVVQIRYTLNRRGEWSDDDDGQDETTSRFSVPRARLILDGGLTDYLSFRLRVGVISGGAAKFEQAYSDVKLSDQLSLRAGILFLPASIGDSPAPQDVQGIDYSQYGLQTSGGNAAGVGARGNFGRVRAQAYFSNGLRTSFSEFAAPVAASFALTGRVEARLLTEDGFDRFDSESSFRGGDLALRLGLAAHYQHSREEGTLPNGDLQQYTADVTLEGNGYNVMVAGRLLRVHPDEGNTTLDPGLLAQAGVFVHERVELWARYDALYSDGEVHSFPDDRNGLQDDYQAVGIGINGYLLPRTNSAKLQADFIYVPDPIATTWADAGDNSGVLQTVTDSQWTVRVQLVLAI